MEAAGGRRVPPGDVDYVVRPEKLRFVPLAEAIVTGKVQARAFLGNYWLFQVTTAWQRSGDPPNIGLPGVRRRQCRADMVCTARPRASARRRSRGMSAEARRAPYWLTSPARW